MDALAVVLAATWYGTLVPLRAERVSPMRLEDIRITSVGLFIVGHLCIPVLISIKQFGR